MTDVVLNSGIFNAEWYSEVYPDVSTTGLSPAAHYAKYGQWLGRGVSAKHPNSEASRALINALRAARKISYCVPIMNRPNDIKETLKANLDENRSLSEQIEFIVIFYDDDRETHDWIRSNFSEELHTGYLRLIIADKLSHWHFGRAKNGFKKFMIGDVYSSLDGDNYVTIEETFQLLSVMSQFGSRFVFHHFTGKWGDGSSGRVSLPRQIYQNVGYDDRFLPRQFDEVDLIISVLVKYIDIPFVRYDTKDHIFSSKRLQNFTQDRPRLPPREHILPAVRRQVPENPRGENYIQQDEEFKAMLAFNQYVSFWKNAVPSVRSRFVQDVFRYRREVVDSIQQNKIVPVIVSPISTWPLPEVKASELALFACVKNDEQFLGPFYDHYKRIGIKHFFIVDDGSDYPVTKALPHADVHVFRPEVGNFATSKGLWLGALIKLFLDEGMWALTVDADEFIDLPPGFSRLNDVVEDAESHGRSVVASLMVDMLPTGDNETLAGKSVGELLQEFDSHAAVYGSPSKIYAEHSSIKWGFGKYAKLSWMIDARFHAFTTHDSLRKVPLFKTRKHLHLNQGFHDLHDTGKGAPLGHTIWANGPILPMRHYKTVKLFEKDLFKRTLSYVGTQGAEYHARTSGNISKIFGGGQESAVQALATVPRVRYSAENFTRMVERIKGEIS